MDPERFEDLPPELQRRLRERPRPDPAGKRAYPRAFRAVSYGAGGLFLALVIPGGWMLAALMTPVSVINGVLALLVAADTDRPGAIRALAWSGIFIALGVISAVALHVFRISELGQVLSRPLD